MAEPNLEYYAALERLIKGKPNIVPKDTRISPTSVAVEAGRHKSAIKPDREVFKLLLEEIEEAAKNQKPATNPLKDAKAKIGKKNDEITQLKIELSDALAREVNLIQEVFELRKTISKLTGAAVFPIRASTAKPPEKPN